MKNSDQPAFAVPSTQYNHIQPGLTKREYFAGLAMQGILAANPEVEYGDNGRKRPMSYQEVAAYSVKYSDALLNLLTPNDNQTKNISHG